MPRPQMTWFYDMIICTKTAGCCAGARAAGSVAGAERVSGRDAGEPVAAGGLGRRELRGGQPPAQRGPGDRCGSQTVCSVDLRRPNVHIYSRATTPTLLLPQGARSQWLPCIAPQVHRLYCITPQVHRIMPLPRCAPQHSPCDRGPDSPSRAAGRCTSTRTSCARRVSRTSTATATMSWWPPCPTSSTASTTTTRCGRSAASPIALTLDNASGIDSVSLIPAAPLTWSGYASVKVSLI